ncbi:hypothetical protein [Marinisporobacter balticus]|uniref:DUF5673 domain-containing protein n=1 Tax=Marinisporobacter balticus TaxID=2018667 RepID=A0A4R2K6T2_9FIRM|nr:hypothetical protein [Marinisporobacter balticus]TCO69001.1 hypothetical protein EV214_13627 [Marinisporobacter balticus]
MRNINLFLVIILIVEFSKTARHYLEFKRYSRNKIDSFKHKSDMRNVSIVVLILSIIFNIWVLCNWIQYMVDGVLLIIYIAINTINYWRKITVFEEGIYFNGRFTKWCNIKSIREYDRNSIRIDLKNNWRFIRVMNKVNNKSELLELSEKFIELVNHNN